MEGPLKGLRVLDLTIARAGPTAVRLLSDWGADVVKVEPIPQKDSSGNSVTGARRGPDEQNLHRNKRSISINLKMETGKMLFHKMVKEVDVVVENFRADVKYRLNVDYETLSKINPRLVYASISGFGQDGPYSNRPGVDQIIQGMSGLMSVTGEPGRGPMRVGVAISDTSAGMFLGQGILLALFHRERTGEGQWVHTSLLESMLCKLDFQGARYTMSGEVAEQQGNDHPTQVPMGTFLAKDGHVNIAAFGDRMWGRFCEALGANELFADSRYLNVKDRMRYKDDVKRDMNSVTVNFSVSELVERLNSAGVPCGPINNIGQAFEDEQVKHLKMAKPAPAKTQDSISLIRTPINLSLFPHPDQFDCSAPDPGDNGSEILYGFGFEDSEIERFRAEGAIS